MWTESKMTHSGWLLSKSCEIPSHSAVLPLFLLKTGNRDATKSRYGHRIAETIFQDNIISLAIPRLFLFSLTFPWSLSNLLKFLEIQEIFQTSGDPVHYVSVNSGHSLSPQLPIHLGLFGPHLAQSCPWPWPLISKSNLVVTDWSWNGCCCVLSTVSFVLWWFCDVCAAWTPMNSLQVMRFVCFYHLNW